MTSGSLKQKILLCVGLALSGAIVLVSGYTYLSMRQQLLETSYLQVRSLGNEGGNNISNWLAEKRQAIQALSEQNNRESLRELQLIKRAGDFLSAYEGDEQGHMKDENPASDYSGYDPRSRPWYQDAKAANHIVTTAPYIDHNTGKLVLTIAMPVANKVVAGDITIDKVLDTVNQLKLPADGFAILTDRSGTIIAHKDPARVLKPLSAIHPTLNADYLSGLIQGQAWSELAWDNQQRLVTAIAIPDSDWELLLVLDKAKLLSPLHQQLWGQIGITLIVLLVGLAAIGALITLLLRPLRAVSRALEKMATDSDLTQRLKVESNDEVGQVAANFNQFVASLHELIAHVRNEAQLMDRQAAEAVADNSATEQELGKQQQEIAMVATAVTEMSTATLEIANNAEHTAAAALQSSSSSQHGRQLVNQTHGSIASLANEVGEATTVIAELSQHANEISSVLSTIQGIAEQTNLLALNAAIEAARAGEQGRGFAVVADEVRVLSKRTAASTTEIQKTIDTLQRTTQQAVTMMQKSRHLAERSVNDAEAASQAIDEVTQAVSQISDMSIQIATAAEEQTKVTEEITSNITAIKEVGDELALGAAQRQQATHTMQQQATELNAKVSRFVL